MYQRTPEAALRSLTISRGDRSQIVVEYYIERLQAGKASNHITMYRIQLATPRELINHSAHIRMMQEQFDSGPVDFFEMSQAKCGKNFITEQRGHICEYVTTWGLDRPCPLFGSNMSCSVPSEGLMLRFSCYGAWPIVLARGALYWRVAYCIRAWPIYCTHAPIRFGIP